MPLLAMRRVPAGASSNLVLIVSRSEESSDCLLIIVEITVSGVKGQCGNNLLLLMLFIYQPPYINILIIYNTKERKSILKTTFI